MRAELVPWLDLVERGSLAACREQGVLRLEGQSYVTRDGDIMQIRSGPPGQPGGAVRGRANRRPPP